MNKNVTVAKYVKKVTQMTASRKNKWMLDQSKDGFAFNFRNINTRELKVGDTVFIAKLENTVTSERFVWTIHQIILPVSKHYFQRYTQEIHPKKKREIEANMINYPQKWFGNGTYIVEPVKK